MCANVAAVKFPHRSASVITLAIAACVSLFSPTFGTAQSVLEMTGVTALRLRDPSLIGAGVSVAQVEAGNPFFEVNPSAVGQSVTLFTWISASGTASTFPNSVGNESGHANAVGDRFFGLNNGVAPGVQHVDNYEAGYFYDQVISTRTAMSARVVNQSFIFAGATGGPAQMRIDATYDRYATQYNTIFVSGVGNSGSPNPPSTAYNGIAVAAFGGGSSVGPTVDNGRSKPDITAPADATSFSTPLVAGAAAILVQAANRGDGGAGTAANATDARVVKTLLLNGAKKPTDWFHSASSPLDPRYGAGILDVNTAHLQLTGGQHGFSVSSTSAGSTPAGNDITSRRGWDFVTISTNPIQTRTNHYYFTISGDQPMTLTSTLTWFGQANSAGTQTTLNNLDLVLLQLGSNTQRGSSNSLVDNVEHLHVQGLAAGRYDLQVIKRGSLTQVSSDEQYALAFDFSPVPEPSTVILIGLGAAWGLSVYRRPRSL